MDMFISNVTALAPSPKDLLLVAPRLAARAGSFVTEGIPEAFENMFGGGITGRAIAEATEKAGYTAATVNITTAAAGAAAAAENLPIETGSASTSYILQALTFHQIRTFGGIFSYMTSKWALGCFAAAIILNRTSIYAASRRHLRLRWQLRAIIRIAPIVVLSNQILSILRAMRCQASPEYTLRRYGKAGNNIPLDFAGENGFLYTLSSLLLFRESEEASCLNVGMIPTKDNPTQAFGSLSLLWPSFLAFCLSQFAETLSCAVEGRAVATENGMSLFEHSLAFAEAEAMIGTQLSLPSLSKPSSNISRLLESKREAHDPKLLPLKGILTRFNTPPEVLLMALISCLNSLSSQILGAFGLQARYRLINTAIWAIAFMGIFLRDFFTMSIDDGLDASIFRFPTVCVVGFLPHLLIMSGIVICGCIYSIALVLSVLSPPAGTSQVLTLRQRFRLAHQNMQANSQLSSLQIQWHEDFYTALLRLGFSALMAASEAVFLNEGRSINLGQWTWLEEDRINEIIRNRGNDPDAREPSDLALMAPDGILVSEDDRGGQLLKPNKWKSGYAKERTTKASKGKSDGAIIRNQDLARTDQRSGRFILATNLLLKIFWLSLGWTIISCDKILANTGVSWRPSWIKRMLPTIQSKAQPRNSSKISPPKELEFWFLSDAGELHSPQDNNFDVEQETKKRLRAVSSRWDHEQEAQLDYNLYSWFTHGGRWGERDSSGDYRPPPSDDDTTSILSSTADSDSGWESESSGRRTPTREDPFPSSKLANNDTTLDPSHLAQLLNPRSLEERDEARMLSAHLTTKSPLTRAQYSHLSGSENAELLTSSKYRPANFKPSDPSGKLTPVEEAEILEYLIVRFRNNKRLPSGSGSRSTQSWQQGAEGLGAGGPMCVVCQSTPRTIIAWPCRCLSLCEECRVSLAMNNFGTCVCCRQEVSGFSRLFVP